MSSKATQFKKAPGLPRSAGLRLAEPLRRVVEGIAAAEGATYSDTLRALIEEALAARAGIPVQQIVSELDAVRFVLGEIEGKLVQVEGTQETLAQVVTALELTGALTDLWTKALHRDEDTMREIRNETARILYQLSGWPMATNKQIIEMQQKLEYLATIENRLDVLQWQTEKVLDSLAGLESGR